MKNKSQFIFLVILITLCLTSTKLSYAQGLGDIDAYRQFVNNLFDFSSLATKSFNLSYEVIGLGTGKGTIKFLQDINLLVESVNEKTDKRKKTENEITAFENKFKLPKDYYGYLRFNVFHLVNKSHYDLDFKLNIKADGKETIRTDLNTKIFYDKRLSYLLIKDFYIAEKNPLFLPTDAKCSLASRNFFTKANNFVTKEIKGKWLEIGSSDLSTHDPTIEIFSSIESQNFLTPDKKSDGKLNDKTIKEVKDYFLKNPIFILKKSKTINKDFNEYEIILTEKNWFNLIFSLNFLGNNHYTSYIPTSSLTGVEHISKFLTNFFDAKVGSILINPKTGEIKKLSFDLKISEQAKKKYGFKSNTLKLNIEFNPLIKKDIVKPSYYKKWNDYKLDKYGLMESFFVYINSCSEI